MLEGDATSRSPWGARLITALGSGSFGLALTALVVEWLLGDALPHGLGPVGFAPFYLYPERVEFPAYLLALVLVPLSVLAGLRHWRRGAQRLSARGAATAQSERSAALPFLALLAPLPSLPLVGSDRALMLPTALSLALALFVVLELWVRSRLPRLDPVGALLGAALGTGLVGMLAPQASYWAPLLAAPLALGAALLQARRPALGAVLLPAVLLPLVASLRVELVDRGQRVATQGIGRGLQWFLVALLAGAGIVLFARRAQARGALIRYAAVPLLLAAAAFRPQVDRWDLDLFHEGEMLDAAACVEAGAVPYRDIAVMHGPGEDVVKPLLGFALFERSAKGLRLADALLTPLAVLAAYAAAAQLLGPGVLAIYALLIALCGPITLQLHSRTLLAHLSLALFLYALGSGRRWAAFAAGASAALTAAWALDTGGAVILGELAALALLPLCRARGRGRCAAWFGIGLVGALALAAALLVVNGALGAFLAEQSDMLASFDRTYSLPFEAGLRAAPAAWIPWLAPAVALVGWSLLLLRLLRHGSLSLTELRFAALLAASTVLFKRGLDRSDAGHLLLASSLAWIPLLFLLSQWPAGRRWRLPIAAGVVLMCLLPAPQLVPSRISVWQLAQNLAGSGRENVSGRVLLPETPALGLWVSKQQRDHLAPILENLRERLRARPSGEPRPLFYDFSNQGALYFLLGLPNPTRYTQVWLAASERRQNEVAASLRRGPPRLVLWRGGTDYDRLDNIDNRVRHYRIAAQLLRFGGRFESVGKATLLETDPGGPLQRESPQQAKASLNLGFMPLVWGEAAPPGAVLARWGYDPKAAQRIDSGSGRFSIRRAGLVFIAELSSEPSAELSSQHPVGPLPPAQRPEAIGLTLATDRPVQAILAWGTTPGRPSGFTMRFRIQADGQPRSYWIPLANHPDWAAAEPPRWLGLAFDKSPGTVQLRPLRGLGLP